MTANPLFLCLDLIALTVWLLRRPLGTHVSLICKLALVDLYRTNRSFLLLPIPLGVSTAKI